MKKIILFLSVFILISLQYGFAQEKNGMESNDAKTEKPSKNVGSYSRERVKEYKKHPIGHSFVFRKDLLKSQKDMITGRPISNRLNESWKCTDTLRERDSTLWVLQNKKGAKIRFSYDRMKQLGDGIFTLEEAKYFEHKFGKANWYDILKGNSIIGYAQRKKSTYVH